mmetsp:Transcript_15763/g.34751  ORF Transcript_15763/g.34751 Transcript_15763/m.34751 type:complete len:201 (-) Transcript_15763:1424-2026(-)
MPVVHPFHSPVTWWLGLMVGTTERMSIFACCCTSQRRSSKRILVNDSSNVRLKTIISSFTAWYAASGQANWAIQANREKLDTQGSYFGIIGTLGNVVAGGSVVVIPNVVVSAVVLSPGCGSGASVVCSSTGKKRANRFHGLIRGMVVTIHLGTMMMEVVVAYTVVVSTGGSVCGGMIDERSGPKVPLNTDLVVGAQRSYV